jgi:hypothetical protein
MAGRTAGWLADYSSQMFLIDSLLDRVPLTRSSVQRRLLSTRRQWLTVWMPSVAVTTRHFCHIQAVAGAAYLT